MECIHECKKITHKNGIGYKVRDKHNSRVNNNDKELIKFTKANSHQVK
jgi:hypothetical protein